MSVSVPQWCDAVIQSYQSDPYAMDLLTKLSVSPASVPHFSLRDGLLRFKDRVWVGANHALRQQILRAMHNSVVGGHSGIPVTLRRLRQLFSWPGLKKDVQTFVTSCAVCQQAKVERVRYPGLLTPLPVPSSAWQMVSLDFIEGLPLSEGKNCILVVVDKFSKYNHFIPLKHPFTALDIAKIYM